MTEKIERARKFAHAAHDAIGQKRKYTQAPYWVHTDEVAKIVTEAIQDEDVICAAHLHDVLEDVAPLDSTFGASAIESDFGVKVLQYVQELTNEFNKEKCPEFSRADRKSSEKKRLASVSPNAQTVKLPDVLSNIADVVEQEPEFARIYLREKEELLALLTAGSPVLLERARARL